MAPPSGAPFQATILKVLHRNQLVLAPRLLAFGAPTVRAHRVTTRGSPAAATPLAITPIASAELPAPRPVPRASQHWPSHATPIYAGIKSKISSNDAVIESTQPTAITTRMGIVRSTVMDDLMHRP